MPILERMKFESEMKTSMLKRKRQEERDSDQFGESLFAPKMQSNAEGTNQSGNIRYEESFGHESSQSSHQSASESRRSEHDTNEE